MKSETTRKPLAPIFGHRGAVLDSEASEPQQNHADTTMQKGCSDFDVEHQLFTDPEKLGANLAGNPLDVCLVLSRTHTS